MQLPLITVTLAVLVVSTGCATGHAGAGRAPTIEATQADMIGTWRFVRATEYGQTHEIDVPFFMRLYADGTAATWPTPFEPISRGEYKVENGMLIPLPESPDSVKAPVTLIGPNAWVLTSKEGHTVEYHRVTPDLEPGEFP